MNDIVVRTMDFSWPDPLDPRIVEGDPEASYFLIGISFLLPYLEPYLIRTMKQAKPRLRDDELRDQLGRFCMQEGQHYRAHQQFNARIRAAGFPSLSALEAQMEADYQRFTESRSLRFNLAYAEGFEALTTALALYLFQDRGRRQIEPAVADMLYWHLIEELEHRTVAFDVYEATSGSYWYRQAVALFAQWHLVQYAARVMWHMMQADTRWFADHGGSAGFLARMRERLPRLATRLLPKVLRTYTPWYTPRRIPFEPWMQRVATAYSAVAKRAR